MCIEGVEDPNIGSPCDTSLHECPTGMSQWRHHKHPFPNADLGLDHLDVQRCSSRPSRMRYGFRFPGGATGEVAAGTLDRVSMTNRVAAINLRSRRVNVCDRARDPAALRVG